MAEEREAERYEYRVVCSDLKHLPRYVTSKLEVAEEKLARVNDIPACAPHHIQRRLVSEWEDV